MPSTPIAPTDTVLIDLTTLNGQSDLGLPDFQQIQTGFDARILATASLVIVNGNGVPGLVTCTLSISDGTGPANGPTPMGESSRMNLPPSGPATVALTGFASKSPGTYNVRASCASPLVPLSFERGNLIVWATALTGP